MNKLRGDIGFYGRGAIEGPGEELTPPTPSAEILIQRSFHPKESQDPTLRRQKLQRHFPERPILYDSVMRLPGMDLPLGTIWCIGRNYAEHAREMGVVPPASPTLFPKH